MHFNLFATGLLLSMASALDLETSTDALLENESSSDASIFNDGTLLSQYTRPKDNCCIVYLRDQYKIMYKDPICWDLKSGKASKRVDTSRRIYSIDCGKNTWADFDTKDKVTTY